jgi:competence protein ComEC
MKRLLSLILALCLLPMAALAEGKVVNLIENPDAEWSFEEGKDILEIVYPPLQGADACILRLGGETMMIDCATDDQSQSAVVPTLQRLGVTHVDVAFNSHPHDDHLTGFEYLDGTATIGKLLVSSPLDENYVIKRTVRVMNELGVPVEQVQDGDVLTLGDATLTVIQRQRSDLTGNDRSAALKLVYGDCSFISLGDMENRAQAMLVDNPPECGMKADIMKYPHHGHATLNNDFLAMVDPELAIITAAQFRAKEAYAYMAKKNIPTLTTYRHTLRLRSDGHIWVVDELDTQEE